MGSAESWSSCGSRSEDGVSVCGQRPPDDKPQIGTVRHLAAAGSGVEESLYLGRWQPADLRYDELSALASLVNRAVITGVGQQDEASPRISAADVLEWPLWYAAWSPASSDAPFDSVQI